MLSALALSEGNVVQFHPLKINRLGERMRREGREGGGNKVVLFFAHKINLNLLPKCIPHVQLSLNSHDNLPSSRLF